MHYNYTIPISVKVNIMNGLLRDCLVAMGTEVSTAELERSSLHAVQADGDFVDLPAVGAERPVRVALDRIGSIVRSIPKDKFATDPSLLLGLIELAAKFEVFLLKLRELDLPICEIDSKICYRLNEIDALRVLRDIVDTFQSGKPIIESGHNAFSCAHELLMQSGDAARKNKESEAGELRKTALQLIMHFR